MVIAPDMELAERFAESLYQELGDNLVQVSLFGSRARRDHKVDSDFDLLIVLGEPSGDVRSRIHMQALALEIERSVDISTKIVSAADFGRLHGCSESFWRAFRRDEEVLWPRN